MNTILIPISGRQQARNILRTDVFNKLRLNNRLVLMVPRFKCSDYKKEFEVENVVFESFDELPAYISKIDLFFGRVALFYINSPTGRFLRKEWLLLDRKAYIRYVFSMTALIFVGGIRPLRRFLRFLDYKLVRDNRFSYIFDKYGPDLVFSPRIDIPLDRSLLRHAKRRGIKTIGMINSWDNMTLTKHPFRLLPDKLVVHNEILKREAIRYLDIEEGDIFVGGLPHFDFYVNKGRSSREEFCNRVGIDSDRRIILFASIGSKLNPTENQVLSIIDKALKCGELPKDVSVIFRFHPAEKTVMDKEEYSDAILFDDSKTTIGGKKRYTEVLESDMLHLADSIHHSEMTIATASTMIIDSAALNRPSICLAFDGYEDKPFHESVERFYKPSHDHYQSVVKSGGTRIAGNPDELISLISLYLNDPSADSSGRARIVKEQCYLLDGMSGDRIANFINSNLHQPCAE